MTTRTTTKKPAATKKPAVAKPAASKPAAGNGVTLSMVAEKLGRDPKSVRASIRRIRGGSQVGRGSRYGWTSWKDSDLVDLMKELGS